MRMKLMNLQVFPELQSAVNRTGKLCIYTSSCFSYDYRCLTQHLFAYWTLVLTYRLFCTWAPCIRPLYLVAVLTKE